MLLSTSQDCLISGQFLFVPARTQPGSPGVRGVRGVTIVKYHPQLPIINYLKSITTPYIRGSGHFELRKPYLLKHKYIPLPAHN